MGAEAYGLVGVFALLNAALQLLDGGLSLTLGREAARFRAGTMDAAALRRLVRTVEAFFAITATASATLLALTAHPLAHLWLRPRRLSEETVAVAVLLMGLSAPLQWMTGPYRGLLNGFERQVALAACNLAAAVLRFPGGALALVLFGPSPTVFFGWQAGVSVCELAALAWMAHLALPPASRDRRAFATAAELRPLMGVSGGLGLAVVVWTAATQVDKVVLSRVLPLADFGVFTVAVTAASAVTLAAAPISQALMPRLTHIAAIDDEEGLRRLYRQATQMIAALSLSAALCLALFAAPLVAAWTGEPAVAARAAPILAPYALGNAAANLAAFGYYLQYARGDLRLHVFGNLGLAAAGIPAIALAAARFGAVGAAWAWLGLNVVYLAVMIPLVHRRLAPGLNRRWFESDLLPIGLAASGATFVLWRLLANGAAGAPGLASALGGGAVLLLSAGLASSFLRERLAVLTKAVRKAKPA